MARTFFEFDNVGITQWPRMNTFCPTAPNYEDDRTLIIDLLSQLFWRQNAYYGYNDAKKLQKQTSRNGNDGNEAQGPVAGGGSPAAQGRSSFSDDSDDGRLSPTGSEIVNNALDVLKKDFPSTSRNDRLGIRGTSLSQAGVLFRSGSGRGGADASGVEDTIEPVNSTKRKRAFSGAETPRAPTVPGSMLPVGAADPSAQRPPPQRPPSQTPPSQACPERSSTFPAGADRQAIDDGANPDSQGLQSHTTPEPNLREANEPTDDKPAHHIFYNIVIHRKTRSLRMIWVDGKIGNRTVRKFFEAVANRVGLPDIQRMKFSMRGKYTDHETVVDSNDEKAFKYVQRSWKKSIQDEMKRTPPFEVDLEIDLATASEDEHLEADLDISL